MRCGRETGMAGQREFKIGVLAGNGIGPEITDATIEVLHTASERTGLKHHRPIHKLATKSCRASSMPGWAAAPSVF